MMTRLTSHLERIEEEPGDEQAAHVTRSVHENGPVAEHDDVRHGREGLVQRRERDGVLVKNPPGNTARHARRIQETPQDEIRALIHTYLI